MAVDTRADVRELEHAHLVGYYVIGLNSLA